MCLGVDSARAELCASSPVSQRGVYEECHSPFNSGKASLDTMGVSGEILRDVGRTFPTNEVFRDEKGMGQNMLANVLRAVAVNIPEVGYCQGMGFVAGAFLLTALERLDQGCQGQAPSALWSSSRSPEIAAIEQDAFWLMYSLTVSRHRSEASGSDLAMRELWLPGCPELKLRVYQFDALLKRELPRLHQHFRFQGLQVEILVTQWFLTLFSYSLPMPVLVRVWDFIFFHQGWKGLFRLGLARLKSAEDRILALDIEEMPRFLKEFRNLNNEVDDAPARQLIVDGYKIKVTRKTLESLQSDFAIVLLKEHLEDGEGEWLGRYGSPADGLRMQSPTGVESVVRMMLVDEQLVSRIRHEMDGLQASVAADAEFFQCKIQAAAEAALAAHTEYLLLAMKLLHLRAELEDAEERADILVSQMHTAMEAFLLTKSGNGFKQKGEQQREQSQEEQEDHPPSTSSKPRHAWLRGAWGRIWRPYQQDEHQSDLELYKLKIADLQSSLKQLRNDYKETSRICEHARIVAEESEELKVALSTQMVQLLLEQDEVMKGRLRLYAEGETGAQ
jgi:hypothetical protein